LIVLNYGNINNRRGNTQEPLRDRGRIASFGYVNGVLEDYVDPVDKNTQFVRHVSIRLVQPCAHPLGLQVRSKRLHALTLKRRHQALAVSDQARIPIVVLKRLTEVFQIPVKRRFPVHRIRGPLVFSAISDGTQSQQRYEW
jgi:hypothetical protein